MDNITRVCESVCTYEQFSDNSTGYCVIICPTSPDYYGDPSTKECVADCPVVDSRPTYA